MHGSLRCRLFLRPGKHKKHIGRLPCWTIQPRQGGNRPRIMPSESERNVHTSIGGDTSHSMRPRLLSTPRWSEPLCAVFYWYVPANIARSGMLDCAERKVCPARGGHKCNGMLPRSLSTTRGRGPILPLCLRQVSTQAGFYRLSHLRDGPECNRGLHRVHNLWQRLLSPFRPF